MKLRLGGQSNHKGVIQDNFLHLISLYVGELDPDITCTCVKSKSHKIEKPSPLPSLFAVTREMVL